VSVECDMSECVCWGCGCQVKARARRTQFPAPTILAPEVDPKRPLTVFAKAFHERAAENEANQAILEAFVLWRARGGTMQSLATRAEKRASQVSRWVGSASNLTLKTLARLLLAMGYRIVITIEPVRAPRRMGQPS
jgi:DNA-binding phage protein